MQNSVINGNQIGLLFISLMAGSQDDYMQSAINPDDDRIPIIVAVEMGYGHLRAAYSLAESFGTEVLRMDLPPVASPAEAVLWQGLREFYNRLSQACDWPIAGTAAQVLLEKITEITPLKPNGHWEPSSLLTRLADGLTGSVVGRRLRTIGEGKPILATYPAAAMAASHGTGTRVFCLATDTDLNRAWAPSDPREADIEYLAPVERVVHRLSSFGVPLERIHLTGFPLPEKLIANSRSSLSRRIHRLDPAGTFRALADCEATLIQNSLTNSSKESISITLAIGGAGSQTPHVCQILTSLRKELLAGKFRLTLVAGTREDVAEILGKMIHDAGLSTDEVAVLFAQKHEEYFRLFEDCLNDTDLLWTKPSELVFYAALGLPILLAPPLGGQEHANRYWLLSNKAALDSGNPATLSHLLDKLLATGELCRIAWNGYHRLDRRGVARIREVVFQGKPEGKTARLSST